MNKVIVMIGVFLGLTVGIGCARLRVEGSKEPIKVDISMRLDIYQHLQNDIDKIENIVSPNQPKAVSGDKHSLMNNIFAGLAYAEDELDPEILAAAQRRKERLAQVNLLLESGSAGENRLGLLDVRNPGAGGGESSGNLLKAENSDRMVIYKKLAAKNNVPAEEIGKLYAKRIQENAPKGAAVEVFDAAKGGYVWQIK